MSLNSFRFLNTKLPLPACTARSRGDAWVCVGSGRLRCRASCPRPQQVARHARRGALQRVVRAAPTVLSRSDWLRGRQRWPRAPWGWWTLEMVMMANPGCPQGNRDPRAEPRPVLLWQGPVQHAAVREAAVKGSLGGGPEAAGGCTGCLTAPCQARHSWVRGVEVPATATQPDSPPLLSWGPLPPTAPLHAQRLCQDLLPPHASPL